MAVTEIKPSLLEILNATPLRGHPVLNRAETIVKKSELDQASFTQAHLANGGMPVLVGDVMEDWPARTKWTFDFFKSRFGEDEVIANAPMFLEPDLGLTPVQVKMRLADYLDYIQYPAKPPVGEYLQGDLVTLRRNRLPLYAPVYRVLTLHPELADDVNGSSLPFVDDLLPRLPVSIKHLLDSHGSPIHYVFFSPTGSVSFLHTDYWSSHAYLAQIIGRKLCVMFSPRDNENVYHGAIRNPLTVDLRRFPRFANAQPYVGLLERGETAIIPSGWWHFVIGLEPCLTYSYNFFERHNMSAYLTNLFAMFAQTLSAPDEVTPALRGGIAQFMRESRAELDELDAIDLT